MAGVARTEQITATKITFFQADILHFRARLLLILAILTDLLEGFPFLQTTIPESISHPMPTIIKEPVILTFLAIGPYAYFGLPVLWFHSTVLLLVGNLLQGILVCCINYPAIEWDCTAFVSFFIDE